MPNSTSEKYIGLGSPWWSRGKDSVLPMLGAKVQSPVRELISHYAEWHIQKIKQAKNKTKQNKKNILVMCSVMAFTKRAELLRSRMFLKTPGIWPKGATHIRGASKHMLPIMAGDSGKDQQAG